DDSLRAIVYNSAGTASVATAPYSRDYDWHNIVIIKDRNQLILIHDGEVHATQTVSRKVSLDPSALISIGNRLSQSGRNVDVAIDELRVDDKAISTDEAYAWYISSAPFYPRGIHRIIG